MRVLVLNAGSSSLKYQVIDSETEASLHSGVFEQLGGSPDSMTIEDAIDAALESLPPGIKVEAVGHRVVHGGEKFIEPTVITEDVAAEIESLSFLAPLHNPANLGGIRAALRSLSAIPHVAVFDTAFHHTLSPAASTLALPRELREKLGVRKYGFHGTSHRYVSGVASELLGGDRETHRVITLHLGNGSSATAIRAGHSIDTSMGFTPTSGLVMGTRPGDIDPAVVTFLLDQGGYSVTDIHRLLNTESGFAGLTGSSDFRDITNRARSGDEHALLAMEVWAWRIRHYIGAYAALLGGLDAVVFTGGIGEHSAEGRALAVRGLEFMGISVDSYVNSRPNSQTRTISPASSPVSVYVIPTQEELEIARQTAALVSSPR